jgi:hypothetical protein
MKRLNVKPPELTRYMTMAAKNMLADLNGVLD